MEEDIKVLENYIKEQKEFEKQFNLEEIEDGTEGQRRLQAIENLIKEYKELEEMLEHIEKFRERNLSSEIDYVIALKSNFMTYLKTDYIPKSKVREKIEKLTDIINKKEEETDGLCITIGEDIARRYLIKLLQEGDK